MTVGSVKHPNVLPQPAAASSARVTAGYDYAGTGSSGGGISGSSSLTHGVGGGGNLRSAGIGSGRISPHSASTTSSAFSMMRSATRRCLFDRPDPNDTRRICEDNEKAERQRAIKQYGFDPYTERGLTSAKSSSATGALHHHRHHHHQ